MSKALDWMAAQIMGRQMPTPRRRQAYNPKPRGHPIQGSGSYAIRELLKATPGRWYTLEELRAELSLTRDQAEWGVRYLRMTGAIESRLDERDRLRPIGRYRCT